MAKLTFEQWQEKVRRWAEKSPKAVRKGLAVGVKMLEKEVEANLSGKVLKRGRGDLAKSLRHEIKTNPVSARVFVDGRQQYKAQTHEYGGVNVPKKEEYLTFPVGGRWVKVKQVSIPPRPFMEPAFEANRQKILQEISKAIVRAYVSA